MSRICPLQSELQSYCRRSRAPDAFIWSVCGMLRRIFFFFSCYGHFISVASKCKQKKMWSWLCLVSFGHEQLQAVNGPSRLSSWNTPALCHLSYYIRSTSRQWGQLTADPTPPNEIAGIAHHSNICTVSRVRLSPGAPVTPLTPVSLSWLHVDRSFISFAGFHWLYTVFRRL